MEPVPVLVEQPTAAPTRKWTFDAVASVIALVLGVVVQIAAEIDLPGQEGVAEGGGLAFLALLAGKIVGYFTKDRSIP